MTVWDLAALAVQRWMVTLACIAVTALVAFWAVSSDPLNFVRAHVVLLPPAIAEQNTYASSARDLVDFAGVVARTVQGAGEPQAVSDDVTLVGEGIRHGYRVTQPNTGGQWQYTFDEPVLDVQATGSTAAEADEMLRQALAAVDAALIQLQDEQGVAPGNRVRTVMNPSEPQTFLAQGSSVRAGAATVIVGIIITAGLLLALGPKSGRGPALPTRQRRNGIVQPSRLDSSRTHSTL